MINFKNAGAVLALGLALAAPALAKDRAMRSGFDARAEAIGGDLAIRSGSRAAALRQCNDEAAPMRDYTWGEEQAFRYRACMAEHGQPE